MTDKVQFTTEELKWATDIFNSGLFDTIYANVCDIYQQEVEKVEKLRERYKTRLDYLLNNIQAVKKDADPFIKKINRIKRVAKTKHPSSSDNLELRNWIEDLYRTEEMQKFTEFDSDIFCLRDALRNGVNLPKHALEAKRQKELFEFVTRRV